jgi:hypothetical protein
MAKNPLYEQLMQKMLAERPDLAPFAELFEKQEETPSEEAPATAEIQKLEVRNKQLQAKVRRLESELDQLLDFEDVLAKALGACEECWGENTRCTVCRGKGVPGYFLPEKELFMKYIKPALDNSPWLNYTLTPYSD